jgi:hypothetical protein
VKLIKLRALLALTKDLRDTELPSDAYSITLNWYTEPTANRPCTVALSPIRTAERIEQVLAMLK